MKPIAYIDADILLHRAVSFLDPDWGGEPVNDWKTGILYFEKLLQKWLKEVGDHSDYHLIISVGPNFRKGLFDDYKGNRKDIIPHPALADLKLAVMSWQETVWELGIEADDLIGIRVSENPNTVALSADKDFLTVPCTLMIPTSHGRKVPDWHTITEAEADRNWMIQSMTGDTIDNYPGIFGVGTVKASDIYDNPRLTVKAPTELWKRGPKKGSPKPVAWIDGPPCTPWQAMVSLAQSKGMSESQMIQMAQLARILRDGDYDFETKEVKLWRPR
jgi:5'-3' exonuclease